MIADNNDNPSTSLYSGLLHLLFTYGFNALLGAMMIRAGGAILAGMIVAPFAAQAADLPSRVAYQGQYDNFGTPKDPMIGYRVGGTITFGGGLALYSGSTVVGGLGLSGDTACAAHSTAWRTRINRGLPSDGSDALIFATNADMTNGHPLCPNDIGTQGASTPSK